jgi:hypothetical protein
MGGWKIWVAGKYVKHAVHTIHMNISITGLPYHNV